MKSFGLAPAFSTAMRKSRMRGRAQSSDANAFAAQVLKRFQLRLRHDVVDQAIGDDPNRAQWIAAQSRAHRARPDTGDIIQLAVAQWRSRESRKVSSSTSA